MNKLFVSAAGRRFCFAVLAAAFIYGLVLPFCWHNDPSDTYGTLSILCEDHIPWFWLWAVLTGLGICLNLELLFRKYGYTGLLLRIAAVFALVGMVLTAATLNHSIQDWNPKRVFHWIGAICYGAGLAVSFIFFFIKKAREYRQFCIFLILMIGIVLGIGIKMFTTGRNGYMEIIPVALLEITLLLLNYTKLVPPVKAGEQNAGQTQRV